MRPLQTSSAQPGATGQALETDNEAIGGLHNMQDITTDSLPVQQQPPAALQVIHGNIPQALQSVRQWVCWRYEWNGNKWTKPPYQPSGYKASKTNPAHYSDFLDVLIAYEICGFSGIGFVLTANDPFVAIDIDHCILCNNSITDEARAVIKALNSYTEISPSGTGIRIFVKGTIPRNIKKGIEIYSQGSYVTVTGQRWQP